MPIETRPVLIEMTFPIWFLAAFLPMVASQIMRLHQHDAGSWIFWDYAGRLAALAILAAIPAARAVTFRRDKRRMRLWQVAVWIGGVALVSIYLGEWAGVINATFPMTVLGRYPHLSGWLYPFDLVVGLALVALHEELIFRRCAQHVLKPRLGEGRAALLASSLLFGCYHWWAGIGTIIEASISGALLMVFLRRSGALWPVVFTHFLIDLAISA